MIVKQYIKDFEKLGLGMFVHFGLYSDIGKGEWILHNGKMEPKEYYSRMQTFNPVPDWAQLLVATAKAGGCKYITLTTRHHDGFSLYDTCGLNDLDAVHAAAGRDLVREFVDACRAGGVVPFFYHTLLDWYMPSYKENFKEYLVYLRKSVELLCKNYGKIGGIWFDGMWHKPEEDWEEDALYGMIRSYQPEAMIINNTGLSARGALGHIELDSVTFERGKPTPINGEAAPKYVASEMCQVFGTHWGYAERDFLYKSLAEIIEDVCSCKKYGANYLLNVGPRADGTLRPLDAAMFETLGEWVEIQKEALYLPRPAGIPVEGVGEERDFLLVNGNTYYLFCHRISMRGDGNVVVGNCCDRDSADVFSLPGKVISATWLDDGSEVTLQQHENEVALKPGAYRYGTNLVVRVAKIVIEP
ncbi:MAG: alpha-L-fucosidase [Clostridia bacterium]|nr:alpha-L-fucosidase [Clostridia bacterium]